MGSSAESGTSKKRGSLFDDGQGDYRILAIRDDGSQVFLPEVPGFDAHRKAISHIRSHGEQFVGMQLAIVRYCDFVAPLVRPATNVELSIKPRVK